jgi:superfamily II DNA helicase RecQ
VDTVIRHPLLSSGDRLFILSIAQTFSTRFDFVLRSLFAQAHRISQIQYYSAPSVDARYAMVHAYIDKLHRRRGRASSGIVYCRTRAACTALADFLRRKGMNAQPYHKGMKCASDMCATRLSTHKHQGSFARPYVDCLGDRR